MAKGKLEFAVVLAGCGVYDGTEIHEAVLTLLAIDRAGGHARCFAPDIDQAHVIDHLTGAETGETRSVLAEAARIARGDIHPLSAFEAADFDALVFPGGFGAAKNLCSFAFHGADATIDPDVELAVRTMRAAGKPIGAMCISPVILARLLGDEGVELTIGNDTGIASTLEGLGAKHTVTGHAEIVIDRKLKVVTSPCYMLEATVSQIADGTANTINALIELIGQR
jgi:enhancing lycopene biosynthesis protein 2